MVTVTQPEAVQAIHLGHAPLIQSLPVMVDREHPDVVAYHTPFGYSLVSGF